MDVPHLLESASNIGFREKLSYPLLMRNSIKLDPISEMISTKPLQITIPPASATISEQFYFIQ
jgi:hypothetical protein